MLEWLIAIVLVLAFITLFVKPPQAMRHWNHYFADLTLSSKDIYAKIVDEMKARELPRVEAYMEACFDSGVFSDRRAFMSVRYTRFRVDVCCAQFGTGCYVSWWLSQKDPGLLSRIPILNTLFGVNPNYPSYYQLDTAMLVQSAIHDAILAVLDRETNFHGKRSLTEIERQPVQIKRLG